jgi:sporulation protein YlmC with PRC-barrel domain
MLQLSAIFYEQPILSLRIGGEIAVAHSPIINPNNLKIEGWYTTSSADRNSAILPVSEIRDIIPKGLVVDDHTALTQPEDMVRLQSIIELQFELLGKPVYDENKKRIGKVADYAVDTSSSMIQKLYVTPSLLRGLSQEQLLIDRSAIIEITDKKIIINDASIRLGNTMPQRASA